MFDLTPYRKKHLGTSRWPFSGFFDHPFFDNFLGDARFNDFIVKADIRETEKEYVVEAEMPGVEKENIDLNCENGVLTITAKQEFEYNEEQENYIRKERTSGMMRRSFALENIKEEGIQAEFKNGLLKITLPKDEEKKRNRRRIDIH